jgi:hypothetical protein
MSKEYGGLGVKDLHIMNKSLLAKWIWFWLTTNNWWKEATPHCTLMYIPWEDASASIFWKSVGVVQAVINCSHKFQVGNGQKIRFWEDCWIEEPLCSAFPNLYQLTENKMNSVAEILVNDEWITSLRNQVAHQEQQQLTIMIQKISLITISDQQQDEVF